jgi:hypothetical protein
MFGLQRNEWQDLVLSVNIHRKTRRLSPSTTAILLSRASSHSSPNELAEALGFKEPSTLRKIMSLKSLPPEIADVVEWGERRGSLSMSSAAEITRLEDMDLMRKVAHAAIQSSMTKEEIRQIVQMKTRSNASIEDCIRNALATRPLIERNELILGSLLTEKAKRSVAELGTEAIGRKIQNLMARQFPAVVSKALRVSEERFSLLLSDEDSRQLRLALKGKSVELMITEFAERSMES